MIYYTESCPKCCENTLDVIFYAQMKIRKVVCKKCKKVYTRFYACRNKYNSKYYSIANYNR